MPKNYLPPTVLSNIHYAKAYYIDDHGSYHLTSSILPDFPLLKQQLDTRRYIFLTYPAKYFSKDSAVFTVANSSLLADLGSSLYVDPRFDNNILHNALTALVLNFIEIKMRYYELKQKQRVSFHRFTPYLTNTFLSLPSKMFRDSYRVYFNRWSGFEFFPLLPVFKKTPPDLFHTIISHISRYYKTKLSKRALFRNHRRLYVNPFFPLPSFSLCRPGKSRVKHPFFFNICFNDLFQDLYSESFKRLSFGQHILSLRYALQCNSGVFDLNRVSPDLSVAYSSRKFRGSYFKRKERVFKKIKNNII